MKLNENVYIFSSFFHYNNKMVYEGFDRKISFRGKLKGILKMDAIFRGVMSDVIG